MLKAPLSKLPGLTVLFLGLLVSAGVAWQQHQANEQAVREATQRLATALNALLQGEEDEDNPLARESLKLLEDYRASAQPVLSQIASGGFDTARVADRMLARPKSSMLEIEKRVERIAAIVQTEGKAIEAEFDSEIRRTGYRSLAVLAIIMLLVVPLTLVNSASIISPMRYASSVAQSIAGGDLNNSIRVVGRDEASDLLRAVPLAAVTGSASAMRRCASGPGPLARRCWMPACRPSARWPSCRTTTWSTPA